MTELRTKRNETPSGTELPWAQQAKLIRSEETGQMVCDLNDNMTRAEWLKWSKDNEEI